MTGNTIKTIAIDTPNFVERIKREQIRLLYANLYNGFLGTPLCVLLVALSMWKAAPLLPLTAWLLAMFAVAGARLYSNIAFNKIADGDFHCRKWELIFMAGTFFAGLLWGVTMWKGFFPDSMPHQVFLLLIVSGLTAGTTMAYSAVWYGPLVFGLPAMLPFLLRFFGYNDPMHYSMGIATLIFIILNASIARNSNSTVMRSLRLMHENTDLVANLQTAREQQAKDLVELRKAKEEAEVATKLKDEFIAAISHDMKSPLFSMKGLLDNAGKAGDGFDELQKKGALSRMAKTITYLLAMLDQLLNHNRLKSGKFRLEKRFINAKELADALIVGIASDASEKKIAINNDLPDDMRLFADPVLYGQVLHNLLTNALKFTPAGGRITVFQPEADKPSVAVRDTGAGVPKEFIEHLFKSDVQTTATGTEGEKGTGLGLPYAFDIMCAHDGILEFETGNGSTFTAVLPVHQAMVLIVDDQPIQRDLMRRLVLTIGKLEVVEAENGKIAAEKLERISPDLVITDLQMPVMDGYALMEHIRANPALRSLPVIAVSANGFDGFQKTKDAVIMAGGDDFLAKPLDDEAFVKTARRYVRIN